MRYSKIFRLLFCSLFCPLAGTANQGNLCRDIFVDTEFNVYSVVEEVANVIPGVRRPTWNSYLDGSDRHQSTVFASGESRADGILSIQYALSANGGSKTLSIRFTTESREAGQNVLKILSDISASEIFSYVRIEMAQNRYITLSGEVIASAIYAEHLANTRIFEAVIDRFHHDPLPKEKPPEPWYYP